MTVFTLNCLHITNSASPEEELAAIEHELNQVLSEIEVLNLRKKYLQQRKEAVKDRIQALKSAHVSSKDWDGNSKIYYQGLFYIFITVNIEFNHIILLQISHGPMNWKAP